MASKKEREDPSVTSMAYDAMSPKWMMIRTILEGTESMRNAKEAYLPRHAEEPQRNYEERLAKATLFNMVELTLNSLVGRPFGNKVMLQPDVPSEIVNISDNINMQGTDITTFCRNWFREGYAMSMAHVLVDMPPIAEEERETRTKADDETEGRRPYWVYIRPEDLIFAKASYDDGKETLMHVRYRTFETDMDGFVEVVRNQIRVLDLVMDLEGNRKVMHRIFEERRTKTKIRWVQISENIIDLDFIPLVTFYADRDGFMHGKPPLEDLAFLNIRHWQSQADQTSILTVARFPMLAVAGATSIGDAAGDASMAIGPRQLLGTRDANGRFYYVEHTGRAIAAGRQDILDMEQTMTSYGAMQLVRKTGNMTATGRALDSAEATSPMEDAAVRFNAALNMALDYTAKWMNLPSGGTAKIKTDFGYGGSLAEVLDALFEARKSHDLSQDELLSRLRDFEVLDDDFDIEANRLELEAEARRLGVEPKDFIEALNRNKSLTRSPTRTDDTQ